MAAVLYSGSIVVLRPFFKKLSNVSISVGHVLSHGLRWGQDENSIVHMQQPGVQRHEGGDGIIDWE